MFEGRTVILGWVDRGFFQKARRGGGGEKSAVEAPSSSAILDSHRIRRTARRRATGR